MHGFKWAGLEIRADGCRIEGNRIGTDATGTQPLGNGSVFPESYPGLSVEGSGTFVVGNVISGNWTTADNGTFAWGLDVLVRGDDNVITGNRIGVGADGAALPPAPPSSTTLNLYTGLVVQGNGNTVGGGASSVPQDACVGTCNLVAGHTQEILLGNILPYGFPERASAGNEVSGNWIGVDANKSPLFPPYPDSQTSGVRDVGDLVTGSTISHNLVHADFALDARREAAVIGNDLQGRAEGFPATGVNNGLVRIVGPEAEFSDNVVQSQSSRGVVVEGSGNTLARNTISDNPLGGVLVLRGTGHVIADNTIRDNGLAGIAVASFLDPAPTAVIARNVLFGNDIGIDLGTVGQAPVLVPPWGSAVPGDGVTPNDFNDGDDGPNALLNYPDVQFVSASGGVVTVRGFVEAPLLDTAPYFVEVFTGTACSQAEVAYLGGQPYGQGEHYLGVGGGNASLGYADFNFSVPDLPPGHTSVSFTATRLDLGITSEFSQCLRLVGPDQVASAEVGPDETGPLFDDLDATVSRTSTSHASGATNIASGDIARGGGGTLYVTRYATRPERNVFADASAPAPNGSRSAPRPSPSAPGGSRTAA